MLEYYGSKQLTSYPFPIQRSQTKMGVLAYDRAVIRISNVTDAQMISFINHIHIKESNYSTTTFLSLFVRFILFRWH